MFVIEGPDYAGKTTLAKKIRERAQARFGTCLSLCKMDPLPEGLPDVKVVDAHSQRIHKWCVWDRFYHSEIVYAPIADRRLTVSPWAARRLEAQMELVGCVSVLLLPTDAYLRRQRDKRGPDPMFDFEQVLRAAARYRALADWIPADNRDSDVIGYTCRFTFIFRPDDTYLDDSLIDDCLGHWYLRQQSVLAAEEVRP